MLINQLLIRLQIWQIKRRLNTSYMNSPERAASQYSKVIEAYDFVTILLIIAVGLGGISEIAKNKLLGYPSLFVGGFGVVVLLLIRLYASYSVTCKKRNVERACLYTTGYLFN